MTLNHNLELCLHRLKEQASAAFVADRLMTKKILLEGVEKDLAFAKSLLAQIMLEEQQAHIESWI